MLYRCPYGSSILLCLVGALCGTSVIYGISWLFQSYLSDYVRVIGGGCFSDIRFTFYDYTNYQSFYRYSRIIAIS